MLVPESAWFAERPGPLLVLAVLVACSAFSGPLNGRPSDTIPIAYTPACHACVVPILPAGAASPCLPSAVCSAIGAPLGSPLPRLVLLELRRPGGVFLSLHEGRRAGGSPYRASAL